MSISPSNTCSNLSDASITSMTPPPRHSRKSSKVFQGSIYRRRSTGGDSLTLSLSSYGSEKTLKDYVKEEFERQVAEASKQYFSKVDHHYPGDSLERALQKIFEEEKTSGGTISLSEIGEGAFGAKKCTFPGKAERSFVVKPAGVPSAMYTANFPEFKQHILEINENSTKRKNVQSKVFGGEEEKQRNEKIKRKITEFVNNPQGKWFGKNAGLGNGPYLEVLAFVVSQYIFGKVLPKGLVPKTVSILAKEGLFSMQDWVDGVSARSFSVSTEKLSQKDIDLLLLQAMAILDCILANTDRNLGNVIVVEENREEKSEKPLKNSVRLVPIDHGGIVTCEHYAATQGREGINFLLQKPFHPYRQKPINQSIVDCVKKTKPEELFEKLKAHGLNTECDGGLTKRVLTSTIGIIKSIFVKTKGALSLNTFYRQFLAESMEKFLGSENKQVIS